MYVFKETLYNLILALMTFFNGTTDPTFLFSAETSYPLDSSGWSNGLEWVQGDGGEEAEAGIENAIS